MHFTLIKPVVHLVFAEISAITGNGTVFKLIRKQLFTHI